MNIVSRTPFRILRAHGVAAEHVETLEQHFGPRFPADVSGPSDAILWALTLLPWPTIAPVLRGWLERALKKGDLALDRRAIRALEALVETPSEDGTTALINEIQETLDVLGRVRGIRVDDEGGVDMSDVRVSDDYRAWAASLAALAAAHMQVCTHHKHEDRDYSVINAAHTAFTWMLAQIPSESRNLIIDKLIQELVGAVAAFVGSWSPGGSSSN